MGPHNDTSDTLTFTLKSIDLNGFYPLTGVGKPDNPVKVIYNPPATIILWKDGSKTVVKCSEDDIYDPMTGFLLCCLKHFLGNDSAAFHRFLKEYGPQDKIQDPDLTDLSEDLIKRAATSIGTAAGRVLDAIVEAFRNGQT